MSATTSMAIRGFAEGRKIFEDFISVDDADLEDLAPTLIETHALQLSAHPLHMIEIELLDAPCEERFFRFGTDPSGMVTPLEIRLEDLE